MEALFPAVICLAIGLILVSLVQWPSKPCVRFPQYTVQPVSMRIQRFKTLGDCITERESERLFSLLESGCRDPGAIDEANRIIQVGLDRQKTKNAEWDGWNQIAVKGW